MAGRSSRAEALSRDGIPARSFDRWRSELRLILEICDEAQAIVAAETITKLGDIEHPPVEVGVDNKGAYDLCHRTTAGKNSRHVERKVFKMRELRHVGKVRLTLVPTAEMRADMLTKPLDDETFARHRDAMMNTGLRLRRSAYLLHQRLCSCTPVRRIQDRLLRFARCFLVTHPTTLDPGGYWTGERLLHQTVAN